MPLIRINQQGGQEMQFVLTGFSHSAGLRVFAFEGIAADRTRMNFSVSADMALIRVYGIRVQELPLLCLRFLEQHDSSHEERNLTFAEEQMRAYADNCTAEREAVQRRKAPRRPPVNAANRSEWQLPQQRR
jgi:hypothetical protein